MGNSEDSIFKTPLATDSGNTYVASFTINTNTGADLLVTKYNDEGQQQWSQTWTGPGNGRDQASAILVDSQSVYVTGITFTSVANNFDYVTLRLSKTTGAIAWVKTHNGTASNYDVATAITAIGKYIYVTGLSNNLNTSIDYTTIKYAKTAGIELWNKSYDHFSMMDIPFGISIIENDTLVAITGASQKNLTDWDYATIIYQNNGVERDTNWVSGTASGFDRAQAVKSDILGNIYITGTISQSITGYDIKTVKIEPNGNVNWQVTYDNDSSVDEGVDLIVDAFQNVYVCGKSYDSNSNYDYVIRKYNSSGIVKWTKRLDLAGGTDEPKKMCFDSFGNIVVTGKGLSGESKSFDFFTAALDTGGIEIWRQTYGVVYMEDDQAQDLAADENGNIYVTGEVILVEHGNPQTVTIKYRSDYFTDPQQIDTPAVANYFYTNYGQIADENGNATDPEKLQYYTIHHYPQLYFQQGKMSMIFSHIDEDTSTTDTLQRVDVSFLNSGNPTIAYPVNEMREAGYYNYFLAHCPDGITDVKGNEKLLFEDVYENIDALYSSNNAGIKLYFICGSNSDPSQIGLFFEGEDNLQIVNNWGLQVETPVGNYEFEKPRVYRITSNGIRNTNWQLNWTIPNPGEALITGWGEWVPEETLVIEISKFKSLPLPLTGITYSTYFGGTNHDRAYAEVTDQFNLTIVGETSSPSIPLIGITPGSNTVFGLPDAFIFNLNNLTGAFNWGTYYAGTKYDWATDVDIDKIGDIYVVGVSASDDLPQHNNTTLATITNGDLYNQGVSNSGPDNFIIKLDKNNGAIVWANYIGSSTSELEACAISVDKTGNEHIYIGGGTSGSDFPIQQFTGTTANTYNQSDNNGGIDGYILRFSKTGSLEWGTYFGSVDGDWIRDIYVVHNATTPLKLYIAGNTYSSAYDTVNPCLPPPISGGFPSCIAGSQYTPQGSTDGFLAEFNDELDLSWSTFIGGIGADKIEPHCLAGYDNSIYFSIFSTSSSSGYPALPICSNCFKQDFGGASPNGFISGFINKTLNWATFWGGSSVTIGGDNIYAINITNDHNLLITGTSSAGNVASPANFCLTPTLGEFPLCDPIGYYFNSSFFSSNQSDAFVASFNQTNVLIWSTLIGGNGTDIGHDICSDLNFIFVVGETNSHQILNPNEDYPQYNLTGAYNNNINAGFIDCYLTRFNRGFTIGVNEVIKINSELEVFPNPVHENLSFKINSQIKSCIKFSIINSIGQEIHQNKFCNTNNGIINLSSISNGIYYIILNYDDNYLSCKFIKE